MKLGLRLKDPAWGESAVDGIRELARAFHAEIGECERGGAFPREALEAMGQRGLVGVMTPPEYGGYGGSAPEYCLLAEATARHNFVSSQILVQGQRWLVDWGTQAQKEKYLRGMAAGTLLFSSSISEPGAGSSLKKLRTTAVRSNGDWVINGAKTHVNLGRECQVTLVYATAEEGLTAFLVDMDLPGVSTRRTDPLGCRLLPTADVSFDNVRVPHAAVLGEPGRGMATFLSTFNVSRLGNASELLGFAQRALADAIGYARGREVGSNFVTDFQGIQWVVADCYASLYGASLARDHAANLVADGEEHSLATSMAKKLAIDAAESTINEVFALIGAHGLYHDRPFGQLLYEIKTLRVAGGSLEVLRNYVARQVLASPDLKGLN